MADERVGAELRQESEAQPNREGVAAGGATYCYAPKWRLYSVIIACASS